MVFKKFLIPAFLNQSKTSFHLQWAENEDRNNEPSEITYENCFHFLIISLFWEGDSPKSEEWRGGRGRKLVTVPGSREVSCMNMPNLNLNFGTIQELLFAQKESLHSL